MKGILTGFGWICVWRGKTVVKSLKEVEAEYGCDDDEDAKTANWDEVL